MEGSNFFISCNWKLKNNLCNFLVEIHRKYQKKCIIVKSDSLLALCSGQHSLDGPQTSNFRKPDSPLTERCEG